MPIGPDTLFDIGSNTKEFTAALILKLEADGKLRLDDTIGRWLPQYPAWKDVTIRSLLHTVSDIPNYSETVEIGEIEAADIHHQFSAKDLVGFVDPGNGKHFPPGAGWFYSNTNYILAGLIIEAASGMNYEQALTTMILKPLGLRDTPTPWAASGASSGRPRHVACASRALFARLTDHLVVRSEDLTPRCTTGHPLGARTSRPPWGPGRPARQLHARHQSCCAGLRRRSRRG